MRYSFGFSLRSSRFLSEIEQASEKAASEGARLGRGEQKIGEKWGVSKREGGGVGRRGIACSQSQTFYRTPFVYERGAIAEFNWLL